MKLIVLAVMYLTTLVVGRNVEMAEVGWDESEGDLEPCYYDVELEQKICDHVNNTDQDVLANETLSALLAAKLQQEERRQQQYQKVCIILESTDDERECHSIDVIGNFALLERAMIEMFSGCVIIEYHLGYIVLEFRACSLPQPCLDVEIVCNPELNATQLGAPQFVFLGTVDNFHSVQLFATTAGYCLQGIPPLPKCADILLPPPLSVSHGNTIALQLHHNKRYWLGCTNSYCHKWGCPGLFMSWVDWTNCSGEVFEIYRNEGPGPILVGDIVGIHHPRQPGSWFSCSEQNCTKSKCPGIPTTANGFSTAEKWKQCGGEVFKIYSLRKSIGGIVESHDLITLYHPGNQDWIGIIEKYPTHRTCPGQVLPPPSRKYDKCWGEVFEIVRCF